jgi:hypothetical protein
VRCLASKPRDFGFAFGYHIVARYRRVRAVVSRGHIAGNLLSAVSYSEGHPKTWPLPRRLSPCPGAVARKAPRLCSGPGYPIRLRCRRSHITARPHRPQRPDSPRSTSHPRAASADCRTANIRTSSQRHRVFRYGTNGSAPLQNPKTLSLPVAIPHRPRCRRCKPWVLAATSFSPTTLSLRIRAFSQSACVKRRSIVRLAVRRQGRANDGLHLDSARSANGFGF